MKNQTTKQLMHELQAAIKDLKKVHSDRTQVIENMKKNKMETESSEKLVENNAQ